MMTSMTTKKIKSEAKRLLMTCFAESAFISMLNIGFFLITYLLIILAGRLTGAHTAETLFPVFSACPGSFVIALCAILAASYILSAPIYYGTRWFFWQAAMGNNMPASSVFAGYSSNEQFRLCVKLRVLSDMRRLPYILVFGTAVIVEGFLARRLLTGGGGAESACLIYGGFALATVGVVYICFCAGLKCIPVGFLLANDPDAVVSDIFELSEKLIKGNAARLMKLYASFIGWFLICLPAFPVIILLPYFNMSLAVFLKDCLARDMEQSTEDKDKKEAVMA